MRVLQLIDSLETGGAERVAVNISNALVESVEQSYLCATRKEGDLKETIIQGVKYLFLQRKGTLDVKAIHRLNKFVKRNDITHIHAHATSFFIGTLIKLLNPSIKLIWHDHYGKSDFLNDRPKQALKLCSRYFNHIFCVNSNLKDWAEKHLSSKSISYLANYPELKQVENNINITYLKGEKGKRIVYLANFRAQKDHITLLKAFQLVLRDVPDWTLHLVGKDFKDNYSKSIFNFIDLEFLKDKVFTYNNCVSIYETLKQCNIGVIASKSEGLPLALLEYGLTGLPVVVTNVGFCAKVVEHNRSGLVVEPKAYVALYKALRFMIKKEDKAAQFARNLKTKVINTYSKEITLKKIIETYFEL